MLRAGDEPPFSDPMRNRYESERVELKTHGDDVFYACFCYSEQSEEHFCDTRTIGTRNWFHKSGVSAFRCKQIKATENTYSFQYLVLVNSDIPLGPDFTCSDLFARSAWNKYDLSTPSASIIVIILATAVVGLNYHLPALLHQILQAYS